MASKVHRFDIDMTMDQPAFQDVLDELEGGVAAIVPDIRNTGLAQIYGVTRKVDSLFVVERA